MTTFSRRTFLTFAASAMATTACGRTAAARLTEIPDIDLGEPGLLPSVTLPLGESAGRAVTDRLLDRAGYGASAAERQRVMQMGLAAYLEEQLDPAAIDDGPAEAFVGGLGYYNRPIADIIELKGPQARDVHIDLLMATVVRAAFSKRQLYESMVEFWSDHFHIYAGKNRETGLLKLVDDRDVIRPNTFKHFRDLLYASATSPAMLLYLDNARSRKGQPNENYARELLELHTLGVNGGYSEQDVKEVARVLTGWGVARQGVEKGQVTFRPVFHDDGAKQILGVRFPAGQGEADLTQLVALLASHPSTAKFVATKLVRRFVADDPPDGLVEAVAQTFLDTDGDAKAMLRTLFLSNEFATAPAKLKRPYSYFVSVFRTLEIRPKSDPALAQALQQMGQVPFSWPAPNGYPDLSSAWQNGLLPRWNFMLNLVSIEAAALNSRYGNVQTLEQLERLLLTTPLPAADRAQIAALVETANGEERVPLQIALLLAHPSFQIN